MELLILFTTLPLVITLILWRKINKLNERLSSLEKMDFISNIKKLQNIKHEAIQEVNEIISSAKNDMETMVSDSTYMIENGPLSEKVEHIKTEIHEAHGRLFRLIVDIYDNSVTNKARAHSWEYIDTDRASNIKLTYAGRTDMVRWLKPAKCGAIYEGDLHMFYKFYKNYAENKAYYKDDDSSFINFMDMYIPTLKNNLTRWHEFQNMSYDDIWVKLAELGTKYNK